MPLKQSSNYLAIAAAFFVALLVVGGAVTFAAHLILAGNWGALFSPFGLAVATLGGIFCLLLALAVVLALAYPFGMLWREPRLLAAAAAGKCGLVCRHWSPKETG
jgi:formate hydrogenlyase subunit 3/multisubunit Na+/H+ antiporter MnhD subunit